MTLSNSMSITPSSPAKAKGERFEHGSVLGGKTRGARVSSQWKSTDSLLRDRLAAQHSWEITQVNEMLTQMERHSYPYACTTNAPELLDAAAARQFLFKVRFLPMTADQIAKAFRRSFGADPPGFVLKLGGLTPADFATVARKASALRERDSKTFAQWLEYEAQAKPDAGRRRIGF
jgi:transitional endoplasmic reticulum ATPase